MYKPKLPPEGINSSEEHPLKEFMFLVVASGIFIFTLLILFIALGKLASHWVSIDQELRWTHELGIFNEKNLTNLTHFGKQLSRIRTEQSPQNV